MSEYSIVRKLIPEALIELADRCALRSEGGVMFFDEASECLKAIVFGSDRKKAMALRGVRPTPTTHRPITGRNAPERPTSGCNKCRRQSRE